MCMRMRTRVDAKMSSHLQIRWAWEGNDRELCVTGDEGMQCLDLGEANATIAQLNQENILMFTKYMTCTVNSIVNYRILTDYVSTQW